MSDILSARIVDITTLDVDAIVNAANEQLAEGGGVCGAIFRAAGPGLDNACTAVAPCPTGEARITPGFRLRSRFIIHAVGPIWYGGGNGESDLLASTYRSAIRVAARQGLTSLAFPAISTGIYGYPLQAAAGIAVETVRAEPAVTSNFRQIIFACFSGEALDAYQAAGIRAS